MYKKIKFLFACFAALYSTLFTAFVVYIFFSTPSLIHKRDAVIVLTGGPGRIFEGLDIYQKGLADKIFISGVHESVKPQHLDALPQIPQDLKGLIAKENLGYEAKNTIGNATESIEWIIKNRISSIYLVTADFHVLRSYIEFKKIKPDLKINLVPVKTFFKLNIHALKRLWIEFGKVIYRFCKITISA